MYQIVRYYGQTSCSVVEARPAYAEFVAAGAVATGVDSLTVSYYAGVSANHVAFLYCLGASGPTITPPGDFTSIITLTAPDGPTGRVFWKRLTGAEAGTSISVSMTGGVASKGVLIGVRNVILTGDPYENATENDGESTSQASDPLVANGGGRLGLRFALSGIEASTQTTGTPPADWNEAVDSVAGDNDTAIQIDYKSIPLGTTAASTRTVVGLPWSVATLAVLPIVN